MLIILYRDLRIKSIKILFNTIKHSAVYLSLLKSILLYNRGQIFFALILYPLKNRVLRVIYNKLITGSEDKNKG